MRMKTKPIRWRSDVRYGEKPWFSRKYRTPDRPLYPRRDWFKAARRYAIKDHRYQQRRKYLKYLQDQKIRAEEARYKAGLLYAEEAADLAKALAKHEKRRVTFRDTVDNQQRYFKEKKRRHS